jgi:hypothetical protein
VLVKTSTCVLLCVLFFPLIPLWVILWICLTPKALTKGELSRAQTIKRAIQADLDARIDAIRRPERS